MDAIPRPAPRVAPATSAILSFSGRPARVLARIAHLLDLARTFFFLACTHAPRRLRDEMRDRGSRERFSGRKPDVAHLLALAPKQAGRIRQRSSVAEAEVHVPRIAHDVAERFPLETERRRAAKQDLVVPRHGGTDERNEPR